MNESELSVNPKARQDLLYSSRIKGDERKTKTPTSFTLFPVRTINEEILSPYNCKRSHFLGN